MNNLRKYLQEHAADKLERDYKIFCMEQLVSIYNIPSQVPSQGMLKGLAEVIGMQAEDLYSAVVRASKELVIPERSGRQYSMGVVLDKPIKSKT